MQGGRGICGTLRYFQKFQKQWKVWNFEKLQYKMVDLLVSDNKNKIH